MISASCRHLIQPIPQKRTSHPAQTQNDMHHNNKSKSIKVERKKFQRMWWTARSGPLCAPQASVNITKNSFISS